MIAARPLVVRCSSSDEPTKKRQFLSPKVQRLRRELESKRIQNLKKIQDVFRKTAEDDLETLLAFVRSKETPEEKQDQE